MSNIIAKVNANLFHIASEFCEKQNKYSEMFVGVFIEPCKNKEGVILTGLAGSHFLTIHDKTGYTSKKFSVVLNKQTLKLCKDTSKRNDKSKVLTILDNNSAIITQDETKIGIEENIKIIENEVSWKKAFTKLYESRKITKEKNTIGTDAYLSFDGELIGKFSEAAKRLTKTASPRLIFSTSQYESILITFDDCDYAMGVLSGMKKNDLKDLKVPSFLD